MMSGLDATSIALLAALASFVGCVLIVLTQEWHGKLSLDSDTTGVQKFHKIPVPRIGGVGMLLGPIAVALALPLLGRGTANSNVTPMIMLIVAGLPAFLSGLVEDMTKKVSIGGRLAATLASALLACWLLGAILPRIDVWGVDELLRWSPLIAVAFTAVAVAGVANSINIIDGFNGIAGSTVIIILAGLGYLGWKSGDMLVLQLALVGAGAAFGFLVVNYPTGRLFLGDGGAYFAGFWVAEVAILLIARNPDITAWQALAVCAYPVIEALYSIYRKRILRKRSPTMPDKLHLHMLVYRRLVCKVVRRSDGQPWIRNAMVAPVLAGWTCVSTIIAVNFGTTMVSATLIFIMEAVVYVAFYMRLLEGRLRVHAPAHVSQPTDIQTDSAARESL